MLPGIENLIRYYNLESDVIDHFGITQATATDITFAPGLYGTGAVFNGSTSNILLNGNLLNPESTDKFSISSLVKANNTNSEYRVISLNNDYMKPYISVRLNAGGVANRITAMINDNIGAKTITTNAYDVTQGLHVGITATQNDNFKLFLNGNLEGINSTLATFTRVTSWNNYLGTARNATGFFLPGMMRGFGVWKTAISDEQMQEVAQKQLSGQQII